MSWPENVGCTWHPCVWFFCNPSELLWFGWVWEGELLGRTEWNLSWSPLSFAGKTHWWWKLVGGPFFSELTLENRGCVLNWSWPAEMCDLKVSVFTKIASKIKAHLCPSISNKFSKPGFPLNEWWEFPFLTPNLSPIWIKTTKLFFGLGGVSKNL